MPSSRISAEASTILVPTYRPSHGLPTRSLNWLSLSDTRPSGSPHLAQASANATVPELHANNSLETDHGRLKARLRPMRGLKRDRTARVIVAGHAFIQNLRRGFYDLGTDVAPSSRLAEAFDELALVI